MKILLDSTGYSQLACGHPTVPAIVRRSQELVLFAVVVGKLLYGYRHGARRARNIAS